MTSSLHLRKNALQLPTATVWQRHADRPGSEACNPKLARQRADAAKAYRVSGGSIDGARFNTSGMEEDSPSQAGDRTAQLRAADWRACRQPDCRFDTTVRGSR